MTDEDTRAFTIRPIREEDAEDIWEMARRPGVIEATMSLPSDRLAGRQEQIRNLTDREHYFVAEGVGRVLGLAGLTVGEGRTRHSGSLFVYVAPESQGQGIGTALLETLLHLADRWLLLRRVELTVMVKNERARALYQRLEFEVEGKRRISVISEGEMQDE